MGDLRQYIGRHWRGELPLSQAYWANTACVNFVLGIVFLLMALLMKQLPLRTEPYFISSYWLLSLTVLVWQSVGVVRTAIRYIDESKKEWLSILALLAMGLIWVKTLNVGWNVGVPQLTEASRIFRGDPQWTDPVITVLPSGTELEYSGAIKAGSAAELERRLLANPAITTLHLFTQGGREKEAEVMADLVRARGLVTYVEQYSASAGVIVYMAGKERVLRAGAKLGFHSSKAPGVPEAIVSERQADFFASRGVSKSFVEKIINTPHESQWFPTGEELIQQGIVTRISDGAGFGLGTAALAKYTVAGLEADLAQFPRFRALKLREPEHFLEAITAAVKSIRRGSDLQTAMTGINELHKREFLEALPYASDAALDAFTDYQLEILRRNGIRAPREALVAIFGQSVRQQGELQPTNALPDHPKEADERLMVAILDSRFDAGMPFDDDRVMPMMVAAMERGSPKREARLQLSLGVIPANRADQIAACETWEMLLNGLKQLSPGERRKLQRYLFRRSFGLK